MKQYRRSSCCARGTPRRSHRIVVKMLARKPDDRFADAGKLHEHLLRLLPPASGRRFG
jgi:hypothetical protein